MQPAADRTRGQRGPTRRHGMTLTALTAVTVFLCLLLTSCTLGPSRRPAVVTTGSFDAGPGPDTPAPDHPTPSSAPGTTTLSPPHSMPLGPGGNGRTAPPIQWHPCETPAVPPPDAATGMTVLCGQVTVPISYDAPARGSLQIAVAAAQTDATPNDAPPLVVMRGDPGRHARTEVADVAASLPAKIREHYMIVMPDVRGTGDSSGLNCLQQSTVADLLGLAPDPTTAAGSSQLASIQQQLTFDCEDTVGTAVTMLNSVNAADDLDMLRAALGVDRLTVLASGGTATVGAVYAHRYPGRVAAMVLDSPRNPLVTPADTATAAAGAAHTLLVTFAAACADFTDGCPLGDDPVGAITDIVAARADSGLAAGPWTMTGGSVLWALVELLPHRDRWPELATAIAALDADRSRPLAQLLTTALGSNTLGSNTLGARLTGRLMFRCNDTSARLTGDAIDDAVATARSDAPLLGPFMVSIAALCGQWPTPSKPVTSFTATGAPPVVVIGSATNPQHPLATTHDLATRLTSARLVTWQSSTIGAYPRSRCVTPAIDRYLLESMTPPRGLLCPA